MDSLKYIGFFDTQDASIQRNYVTSAANKMEYIVRAIASSGQPVEIRSASSVIEHKFRYYKSETKRISSNITLFLPSSWGGNNIFIKKIRILWNVTILFFFLLFNARKNEPILVYHSLGYLNAIIWAKKIRKFKLILETEEIYTDVSEKGRKNKQLEYETINTADAYLFSTELLNEKLNVRKKTYCVNYGTYQVEKQVVGKFNDGKIHVVYAGTFDPRKGGAAAAEFLPGNYHVHICGFGNDEDTINIKDIINDTQKKSKASISFEGLLKGRDFIEFIQKCHIGLSTQNPDAAFNATSFPSKILSYMVNGLSVVSINVKAIKDSKVGPFIHFYEKQTPEEIATAILSCETNNSNREIIENLDSDFKKNIASLLRKISLNCPSEES